MMKKKEYFISISFFDDIFPIRDRIDIIKLQLFMIQIVNSNAIINEPRHPSDVNVTLYIDRMNRLFITLSDKTVQSIHFPFVLYDDGKNCHVGYRGFCVTSIYIAIIESILRKKVIDNTIEELLDAFWEQCHEYEIFNESEIMDIWHLLMHLLTYEPGYIRFDSDIERSDPLKHPENHVDFFYSNGATCKLGINQRICKDELLDILDVGTTCYYMKKMS